MKTSTIQLLAIASAFSVSFAAPVPAEVSPIAQYYDTTVSQEKSGSSKAVDALGFKQRRADTVPLAEYVDKTIKDLESKVGKASDAARKRAEVTPLAQYADKTLGDEKGSIGHALENVGGVKFRRYTPTRPAEQFLNKTRPYFKTPRGEYLPELEHKEKDDEHKKHDDDVLEYKITGEYAEAPSKDDKKDSEEYVKETVDEYAKKVPAAPKPAYPEPKKEHKGEKEHKGDKKKEQKGDHYDVLEDLDFDKRQDDEAEMEDGGMEKRQDDTLKHLTNPIAGGDVKRQESVSDFFRDAQGEVNPDAQVDELSNDLERRQESVGDFFKDAQNEFNPSGQIDELSNDLERRQQGEGEGQGEQEGEHGDGNESEEEGEHEGEGEQHKGEGKEHEGEGKEKEGEGEGHEQEGQGEGQPQQNDSPFGLRRRYNQASNMPKDPKYPQPAEPEHKKEPEHKEPAKKPAHHDEDSYLNAKDDHEDYLEEHYYEAAEYKQDIDHAVSYADSKAKSYAGEVPKVPAGYPHDDKHDHDHDHEDGYKGDHYGDELKDYIVAPKKEDYAHVVPSKPSYPAVPKPSYPAAGAKPSYIPTPVAPKEDVYGDKYASPVHEIVDEYAAKVAPKTEYPEEHEEPKHEEPKHEEPKHEEPKHEDEHKDEHKDDEYKQGEKDDSHKGYDLFEGLDITKRQPIETKPLGQYVDGTVNKEKSGAGKGVKGATTKPAERK